MGYNLDSGNGGWGGVSHYSQYQLRMKTLDILNTPVAWPAAVRSVFRHAEQWRADMSDTLSDDRDPVPMTRSYGPLHAIWQEVS